MRSVTHVIVVGKKILATCNDGTLWETPMWEEGGPEWKSVLGPPDGRTARVEKTLEEQAEDLALAGGRGMIIATGKI